MSFTCVDAKEVLLQLLVDDGSQSRGHRKNVLNDEFNWMGCYTGEHSDMKTMTVITYAAGYVPNGADDPI
jgi:uncharacterized protein YkwD